MGGKNLLFVMSQRELRLVKTLPARYWLRPLSLPDFEEGSKVRTFSFIRTIIPIIHAAGCKQRVNTLFSGDVKSFSGN